MKFGVVLFPGSNCDHDAYYAVRANLGREATLIWHESEDLSGLDAVLLPGGFSYGDYLRPGAIARFSPVIGAVKNSRSRAASSLGSVTASKSSSRAACCPGR